MHGLDVFVGLADLVGGSKYADEIEHGGRTYRIGQRVTYTGKDNILPMAGGEKFRTGKITQLYTISTAGKYTGDWANLELDGVPPDYRTLASARLRDLVPEGADAAPPSKPTPAPAKPAAKPAATAPVSTALTAPSAALAPLLPPVQMGASEYGLIAFVGVLSLLALAAFARAMVD